MQLFYCIFIRPLEEITTAPGLCVHWFVGATLYLCMAIVDIVAASTAYVKGFIADVKGGVS